MDSDFFAGRRPNRPLSGAAAGSDNTQNQPKNKSHHSGVISNGLPFRGSRSERQDDITLPRLATVAEATAASKRPTGYDAFIEDNDLDPIEMADEPTPGKKGKRGNSDTPSDHNRDGSDNDGKTPWYRRFVALIKAHPQISMGVAAAIVILVGGGVTYAMTRPAKVENTQLAKVAPKPKPTPPPPTSPLTGMAVSAEDAKRPVTGVMIENTTFARPQSGLKEAGVVYEAIAEAGITRFLALYQEAKPANIGPVRSARPYYVDWAHSFDAAYGHVGGSPDALAKIKTDGVKDLDQFYNSAYYHRISSRDAPHNMYTNMTDLDNAKQQKGWTSSTFTSWPRKKDAPAKAAAITAKTIDFAISGPTYNAHYDYAPETNTYNRSEGGEPHMDAESKTQLSPKVVIALVIPYSLESDGYHSNYQLTGTGSMVVFQDGTATKGTWKRSDGASQYEFSDEQGHPLKLDAGQTWLTAVSKAGDITYTP